MKVGFIGAGRMAEAIMSSLITTKTLDPHQILACDVSAARRTEVKRRLGVNAYSKARLVVDGADVLFLAIKPQDMDEALAPIADRITREHLVISIAAGKTIAHLEDLVPNARVIRVMPNLPVVVGEGMSAFCLCSHTTPQDQMLAKTLLGSTGRAIELPETVFDAVTALSGSGPAFFAYLLDCMVDAVGKMGIERRDALLLAEQTMLGSAKLLLDRSMDPKDLVDAVSSPKGTTVEGLGVLEPSDVSEVLRETIEAAARRSRELSG